MNGMNQNIREVQEDHTPYIYIYGLWSSWKFKKTIHHIYIYMVYGLLELP